MSELGPEVIKIDEFSGREDALELARIQPDAVTATHVDDDPRRAAEVPARHEDAAGHARPVADLRLGLAGRQVGIDVRDAGRLGL